MDQGQPGGTAMSDLELARARARAEQEMALAVEGGPNWVERQAGAVADFFTGDDRVDPADKGVKELPGMRLNAFDSSPDLPPGFARATDVVKQRNKGGGDAASLMGVAAEDTGKVDILERITGPLPQRTDSSGNIIVTITPEKAAELSRRAPSPIEPGEYFIDRPGVSAQDVTDFAPEALLGALLGPAGRIASTAGRAAVMAAGGAGESLATDIAAQVFGSEDPVSIQRALISGAAVGVADAAFSRLARALASKPALVDGSGNLTDQGRAVIEEMGLDIDQIGPRLQEQITAMVRQGVEPQDAARAVEAADLPVPVPLSRGQVTGSPRQQMLESQAAEGALGEGAERVAKGAQAIQQEAVEGNVAAIGSGIGDNTGAIQTAQQTLLDERQAAKAGVDAAYDAARQTRGGIPSDNVREGALDMVGALDGFNVRNAPQTYAFVDDFDELATKAGDGAVVVDRLEAWRTELSNHIAGAQGAERAAGGRLLRRYDEMTEQWTKDAIVQGDENALALWRDAVKKRRNFGKQFESGDIVEIMTAPGRDGEIPGTDELIARLFGTSGFAPKKEMAKAFRVLKKRLPEGQFDALRSESWTRLVDKSRGARQADGSREVSGANLLKNIENMKQNHPDLWRTLFKESERKMIDRFARTVNRITTPVRGGRNYSGTAAAISRQMQAMWEAGVVNAGGLRSLLLLPGIRLAVDIARQRKVSNSFVNAIPVGPAPFTPAAASAGGE